MAGHRNVPPAGTEHPGHIPIASYLWVLLDRVQERGRQRLAGAAVGLAGSWSSSRLQGKGTISNGISGPRGFVCVVEGVTVGMGQGKASGGSGERFG